MNKLNEKTNRLIRESSPYLQQHAHNPVDWYPWGEEAFMEAKERDIPLLVSIGYSACHWCHVMERESFENPEIAKLMNEYFVNIKVDREERPDIDHLYQQAVGAITGQGGWPLTVFLDPEQRPFFGGTYFPPTPMYGRLSFPDLLKVIHDKWQNHRSDIIEASQELHHFLQSDKEAVNTKEIPDKEFPLKTAHQLYRAADTRNGGLGKAPKFPNVSLLQLFIRLGVAHHQSDLVEHVKFTLRQMAKGGIYDHLGGGFHRYSTDEKWLVPHFEKMLYDNAQLIRIYTMGYQLTQNEEFQDVVYQTADYIRREMTAPEGGFYATQDADSEGVEGKYFVWKLPEVREILGEELSPLFIDYYGMTERGNFEGANILNQLEESALSGDKTKSSSRENPDLKPKINRAKELLFKTRESRVKPFRDEKVITSWNGLMIGALAYAYQVFGRNEDYQSSKAAGEFIWNSLNLPRGLTRIYKNGEAKVEAMLDDYVFLAEGFLELYEADFNKIWLERSLDLSEKAISCFGGNDGHYYLTAKNDGLLTRPISGEDQAIPSGVSVHCENLLRLNAFTGRNDLFQEAERILKAYSEVMQQEIWAYAGLIGTLDRFYQGTKEFAFISEDTAIPEILSRLRHSYIPYRIVAQHNTHQDLTSHPAKDLFLDRPMITGKPTCYPCSANRCFEPVTDWQNLHKILVETLLQ
jgi:uncharacterized protein YyaL (SSP411 family)